MLKKTNCGNLILNYYMFQKLLYLIIFIPTLVFAQEEVVSPLRYNPIINAQYQKNNARAKQLTDTLNLPFFDDFSYDKIYPSNQFWIDSFVFINNTFGYNAISKGVATFDGFNKDGQPYTTATGSYGVCDTLTSAPINLNYSPSDSVYLRFYIQPQGNGRAPSVKDSLLLEFKNGLSQKWEQVIRFAGSPTQAFQLISIPITAEKYLYKGFQFRFKNKGAQFGGDDHWNIDYVKLVKNSNCNDTIQNDVSITGNATSLLKPYAAVPFNQFNATMLAENHFVSIRNNFVNTKSASFTYTSRIKSNNQKIDSATRGFDLLGEHTTDSISSNKIIIPVLNHPFVLKTRYTCSTGGDFIKQNDTLVHEQIFSDYFAYDDGTAENGYGITPSSDGRFAYHFNAPVADTLSAISFFFTQKEIDNHQNLFTLTVWKSLVPEVILYQKTSLNTRQEIGINDFVNYELDSSLVVSGEFYVGWIQSSNYLMNVGLDRNYVNNDQMFYKVNSIGWQQSAIKGSVMIRPVFSDAIRGTGINQNPKKSQIVLYPNPGNGNIHMRDAGISNLANYKIAVFDLMGRNITYDQNGQSIQLIDAPNGIYFIRLQENNSTQNISLKYYKNE